MNINKLSIEKLRSKYKFLERVKVYDLIFLGLLIFIASVALETSSFSIGITQGDVGRDYLVASEIINPNPLSLQKLPSSGPFNTYGLINSPVYYYLISFFLIFNNSFVFMNFVNFMLQLFLIVVIYILTRSIFGGLPALAISLFTSFDLMTVNQFRFMWQPHIMQPFLYLSYLLLYLSWRKKSNVLVHSSLFLAIFAGVLHNSAFAVLPIMIILALYILRMNGSAKRDYLTLLLVIVVSLLIMYAAPLKLIYDASVDSEVKLPESFMNRGVDLSPDYSIENLSRIDSRLKLLWSDGLIPQSLLLATLFLSLAFMRKNKERFYQLLSFGVASVLPFIILSGFGHQWPGAGHYTILSVGTLYIFIIGTLYSLFSIRSKDLGNVAILILVFLSLISFLPKKIEAIQFQFAKTPDINNQVPEVVEAIKNEILDIKETNNLDDFNFFILRGVHGRDDKAGILHDAIFWLGLEKELDDKFIYTDRRGLYESINRNDYIFLICTPLQFDGLHTTSDCRDEYLYHTFRLDSDKELYKFEKQIYSKAPVTVFLGMKSE